MDTRPVTLHPFEPSDFRTLAEIYRLAFFQTRLTNFILAGVSPQACDDWFVERLANVFADQKTTNPGHDRTEVEVVVAKRGHERIGFAWWDFFPRIEERDPRIVPERFWPQGMTASREVIEYMKSLDGADDLCETPHWHLNVLAVHPQMQGQGVGRLLTEWGIDRARRNNADAFLVSTELGRPMYSKLGFVDIGQPLVHSKATTWPMVLRLRQGSERDDGQVSSERS